MRRVAFLLIAASVFAAVFSCNFFFGGVEVKERINLFMADVNAGKYAVLYTHFHPTETAMYNEIKDPAFWNVERFPPGETYVLGGPIGTIEILSEVATGTITSDVSYSNTYIFFLMAKSGDDYMIKRLVIEGTTYISSIVPPGN